MNTTPSTPKRANISAQEATKPSHEEDVANLFSNAELFANRLAILRKERLDRSTELKACLQNVVEEVWKNPLSLPDAINIINLINEVASDYKYNAKHLAKQGASVFVQSVQVTACVVTTKSYYGHYIYENQENTFLYCLWSPLTEDGREVLLYKSSIVYICSMEEYISSIKELFNYLPSEIFQIIIVFL
jgi:hypothetical protein